MISFIVSASILPPCGALEAGDSSWVEIDGAVFGCVPDNTGPVGGARGYARAVYSGDYNVASADQLIRALRRARPGETVFVLGSVELDFTGLVFAEGFVLSVPGGVTLAGSRGLCGSAGALLKSDAFQTSPLIRAEGPGVRITGLRIQGPDPERRVDHWQRSFSGLTPQEQENRVGHEYYYRLPTSQGVYTEFDDLEVDNCELYAWSHAAVVLSDGTGHHVHHNFIHSNQRHGLGYGVAHGPAFSLIEYNLFEWNRHSIAGSGRPPSGYVARHNLERGQSLSHNFDMHGGRDRRDGTNTAGSRIEIYNNTFLSRNRAIGIRGRPEEYARIYGNWFVGHLAPCATVIRDWPPADTVELGKNLYGASPPTVR
ncbi:MAG: hypothetical protein JW820_01670 [Spirochaetales bacterium]|nr:hypothetical protein [Spirochaetales bacterium]